jgi:tricarballylate dehydrogenase
MPESKTADVIVVGAGNAAMSAAIAARDKGAAVLVLEAAPREERGGNSTYTAGAMRTVYNGVEDIRVLVPELTDRECADVDFGSYSAEQFFDDMYRLTRYRTHPELCELLVRNSFATLRWVREQGVRFEPALGRQAFKVDGKFKFWGGLTVAAWGGGPGLIEAWHRTAGRKGIAVRYEMEAVGLLHGDRRVEGIRACSHGGRLELRAAAVVLACGGFESNAEMRARYLGPNWDLAKVRGTRFNSGLGHRMALDIGAMPWGHWSGCHAVGWDLNAPPFGDLTVGDNFQKHSYPFGIMVNARGERFVDEGADFRNYTYAKYGHEILRQPEMLAWQVFDRKVLHLLRDEYRIRRVTKVAADTLEHLAARLEGVDGRRFLETVRAFNGAVQTHVPFNPNVKDGRGTTGLAVPKSNWANPIDEPPFEAYATTCGITFTFGGLKITSRGEVEDTAGRAIPGLYAAGEIVGGLFYHNYPGGTGLTSGAVFGKIAGESAAAAALATGMARTASP